MRSLTNSPLAEDLIVGFELEPFERTAGLAAWNRFAAVNDEFVPIHMDDDAGQAAGYPSAFGMGNLQLAYIHAALRAWLGEHGEVVNVAVQYRQPSLRGVVNRAGAIVTDVAMDANSDVAVSLDVWVDDGDGQRLTPGTAIVRVFGRTDGQAHD